MNRQTNDHPLYDSPSRNVKNYDSENRASAPVKAFDLEGESPSQANVTGL